MSESTSANPLDPMLGPAQDHHLLVGHLGSFRSSNLEVARDARHLFHGLEAEVIKSGS